jgi:alpha-N-arabinofuranosidase
VDGPWQIGFKTPQEYARAATEFAKVMKWVDPSIKLIACGVSNWASKDFVERGHLVLEQAGDLIDYISMHWYLDGDTAFAEYMTSAELLEDRLSAYEGMIRAVQLERGSKRPIYISVDEWNSWHRSGGQVINESKYNLADALVTAMHFNAFIRHAKSVKMANIAQIVNILAPIFTKPDGLFLQTIFYPFELYSQFAGSTALDVHWDGDTFSAGDHTGIRTLDVTATLDAERKQLAIFVVNRSEKDSAETTVSLAEGRFNGAVQVYTVNGADVNTENSFAQPGAVHTWERQVAPESNSLRVTFEPHSVTALVCPLG